MEIFQLRYFAAAARIGNFSRAAEACHISQPSLSLQIARLEQEVGTALFLRQGRSVILTDAGKTLAEYAERILMLESEGRRAVREVVGLERGRLSLFSLPTPAQHLLPAYLVQFRTQYPRIEITLHEVVPARRIAEAVMAGQADLGFLHLPCSVSGLAMREILTEELVLVVPDNHPLVGQTPQLADLASEIFVWAPEGDTPEHPLYAACLTAGFTPKIACISGSASGMQTLVSAGLGIALLPRLAAHPPAGACIVELATPRPTRTVAVAWREESLSHAARAFLELL
jgi:LysR family transcriptional regulator, hydrogen peroxide-inducible genes activator